MLTLTVVGLGLIAGLTIFLGMPLARHRGTPPVVRAFLAAFSAGILLFLFWDIVTGALGPVLADVSTGDLAGAFEATVLALGGLALSYLGLVAFERIYRHRAASGLPAGATPAGAIPPLTPSRAMSLIAIGIGLHNLAEGLAIGAAYVQGLTVSLVLVVGFAVHNATEGFGIVGPAMGGDLQPSWRRLGALGLMAGGPTVVGSVVGSIAGPVSLLSTAFLAIAAGAILYVVIELVQFRGTGVSGYPQALGVFSGFALGLVTDLVLVASHI